MCRAGSEGGRRCPGCQGKTALAKHNERRRNNRAIRRNVAKWAQQAGYSSEEVARLVNEPPNVAKEWIREKGLHADDFIEGIPTHTAARPSRHGPPLLGEPQDQAGQSQGSGDRAVVPAPAQGGAPAAGGGGAAAGGANRGNGWGNFPVVDPAVAAKEEVPWTSADWCTDELRGQIHEVMAQQGSHRDERSLLSGEPTRVTKLGREGAPAKGSNLTLQVELDNGMVGYFKPFGGENKKLEEGFGQDSAQQSLHEAAAWRLASQLGPPWSEIVPPVVIREVGGEVGSFALERPGKIMEREPWHTGEWREAGFFDALIGQQDRHPGNYLVSGDRIALIDHGYSFAKPGDYMNYSWLTATRVFGGSPVIGGDEQKPQPGLTYQEREALQRLVASSDLLGMSKILQPARADALRARAESMLEEGKVRVLY